jgi:hypothetical protein
MKKFMLTFLLGLSFIIVSKAQVNRYTQPPPFATYEPMTFDELLYAPSVKNAKANENLKKVERIVREIDTYVEINGFDDKLKKDLEILAKKYDKIFAGDLSQKDQDIYRFETTIKKYFRDYEIRLKNEVTSSNEIKLPKFLETKKGFSIFEKPSFESSIVGTSGVTVFVIEQSGKFYKIKFNGKESYVIAEALVFK